MFHPKTSPLDRCTIGKLRGIGIANVVEHTGQGAARYPPSDGCSLPGFDSAHVEVEPNGRVIVRVSQSTQGQGHPTAFAQVVADQLGVEVDDVTVVEGDTERGPYGTGTFASRGR